MNYTESNGKLIIDLAGKIDTNNATAAENEIFEIIGSHEGLEVVFDAGNLEYISSAGLRVLLMAVKKAGKVTVINVSDAVKEIFETTGFDQMIDVR